MNPGRFVIFLIVLIALLFVYQDADAQCAMCKAVAESNQQNGGNNVGEGLNNGILYLMGVPYLLLMGVGFVIYKKVKQQQNQ